MQSPACDISPPLPRRAADLFALTPSPRPTCRIPPERRLDCIRHTTMQTHQRAATVTASVSSVDGLYADHVNPQWVKLLNVLQMNVHYERCAESELFATGGRRFLDFLSGYCV